MSKSILMSIWFHEFSTSKPLGQEHRAVDLYEFINCQISKSNITTVTRQDKSERGGDKEGRERSLPFSHVGKSTYTNMTVTQRRVKYGENEQSLAMISSQKTRLEASIDNAQGLIEKRSASIQHADKLMLLKLYLREMLFAKQKQLGHHLNLPS